MLTSLLLQFLGNQTEMEKDSRKDNGMGECCSLNTRVNSKRERERKREMWVFQDCGEVEADTLRVNMISTTLYKSMSRSFVAFERA